MSEDAVPITGGGNGAGQRDSGNARDGAEGASQPGRFSLSEMLKEIAVDGDGVAGGVLLDQRRIDSLFGRRDEE